MASKRYTVAAGTQVNHDGKLYPAGATLTAFEQVAAQWVAQGYVVEAKAKSKS